MRLIDADLFMEKLLSMKRVNKELPLLDDDPEVNNYDVGQEETLDLVIGKLSEQPTVDTRTPMGNIVEKLEERRIEYELSSIKAPDEISSVYRKGVMRGYEYSRDLVKQEINNGLE